MKSRSNRLGINGRPHSDVYLDSSYYKGHCKVMYVSSTIYPVIIGNLRGACQKLPDPDWKAEDQRGARRPEAEDQRGARARTNAGNNDDNNQGDDMPGWKFKEESNIEETKNRDSKKKPAQLQKNENCAT